MAKGESVRIYVGTRKGGYVVESNTQRKKWAVRGPFQHGRDVFHLAPDPREPGTVYAAVNSGWWGPMMLRSKDYGKKWTEIATPLLTKSKERGQPQGPWGEDKPVTNLWHIEPGPADEPGTIFLGIDPASLFRSDDRGNTWSGVAGLNEHETRPKWNPGAGGMCLHTIILDPTRPKRMYVGISAAGTFRSDDGGEHFRPVNKGVRVSFQPDHYPAFGQCVHKVVLDPANPNIAYRQDHDGIYVSHDEMESWKRVGKPLPSDFGFNVTAPRAMPGNAFFVPLDSWPRTAPGGQLQVWRWNDRSKAWAATVKGRPWPGEMGMHREGMASDALDPAGIYVGTTTGQLLYTNDGAKRWGMVPYQFPSIQSVTVSSPTAE